MSPCNACFAKMLIGAGALLLIPIAQAQVTSLRASQRLPMPPNTAPQPVQEARFGEHVATDGQTILVTVSQGPAAYCVRWSGRGARHRPGTDRARVGRAQTKRTTTK